MVTPDDIQLLRRRAFTHAVEDGLTDIFIALVLFIASVVVVRPGLMAFLAMWVIFGPILLHRLKCRFTYPRTGFVELPQESPRHLVLGMFVYMVIALVAMAVLLWLADQIDHPQAWRKWAPILAAILVGGGIQYVASRSGLIRYHVFQAVSAVTALTTSLLTTGESYAGVQTYCLIMSAVALLMGLVTFRRFLKCHPVSTAQEESDVAA